MAADRNLLLIFARGWRVDVIGDAETWPLRTPHLERLARQGLRAVASSACPHDVGGMTSLLTGLHARQHGRLAPLRADEAGGVEPPLTHSFAHWLAGAGYHVAGVGNIAPIATALDEAVRVDDVSVVEPDPRRCAYWAMAAARGLSSMLSDQRRQRQRSGPFDPLALLLEPEDDVDGFIARKAVAMLERLPSDKPWALFVMFTGPGNDLPAPTLYDRLVDPASVQSPFVPVDLRQLDTLGEPAYPRALLQRVEPATVGRIRADYLGRVGLLDHAVGQLVSTLSRRDDADRIWTVASADRGHLLGEHGLVGGHSFLGPALEVPLLLVPPSPLHNHGPQLLVDGLVSTVDVAPTIAALAAADAPASLAGRSLLPMLQAHAEPPRDGMANLSEFHDRLMLETEQFKAIFDRASRACVALYDLFSDPQEKDNLAERMRGSDLIDTLRLRLADALLPLYHEAR